MISANIGVMNQITPTEEANAPLAELPSQLTLLTPDGLARGLSELFDLAVKGALKVHIGPTFSLKDAAKAHRAMEARKTVGKVVMAP